MLNSEELNGIGSKSCLKNDDAQKSTEILIYNINWQKTIPSNKLLRPNDKQSFKSFSQEIQIYGIQF